jgi:hypothetical protein
MSTILNLSVLTTSFIFAQSITIDEFENKNGWTFIKKYFHERAK